MSSALATAALLAWMRVCCQEYDVDAALALAVAQVESGLPGVCELRVGPMGKGTFAGPMGIRRSLVGKAADNPYKNVEIGVRSLSRLIRASGGNIRRALNRYNPEDHSGRYKKRVMSLWRKNRKEGRP